MCIYILVYAYTVYCTGVPVRICTCVHVYTNMNEIIFKTKIAGGPHNNTITVTNVI